MNIRYTFFNISIIILLFFLSSKAQEKDTLSSQDIFNMSLEELMNIEVYTASKHFEKISDIPASIIIITKEEIETFGFKSLEDILQNIAGFYMIDDYFWLGSVNFGIRGFFSTGSFNDVIIMVNGVNQVGDSYSDFPSSKINVPVEVIDKIEIVRGPMSVMYGSGAFMGAINIITNESGFKKKSIKATASVGSLNNKKVTAKISGKEGNISYVFNAGIRNFDGINEPIAKMTSNPEVLKNYGLTKFSKTEKMLSDDRKYFGLSAEYKNFNFDFEHNETSKGVFDGLPSINEGTIQYSTADNVSIKYQNNLCKRIILTTKMGFFSHIYSWKYNILFDDAYASNSTRTSSYELDVNVFYNNFNNFDIQTGFFFRTISDYYKYYDYPIFADQYSNTESYISGPDVKWFAFYTQGNLKINRELQITFGLRFERLNKYNMIISAANETEAAKKYDSVYDEEKIKVIPRAALIYKLSSNNIFKFLYGKAVKQPSVNQNFSQLLSGYNHLQPAEVTTMEFNYIFSPSSKLAFNFSLFNNQLKDLIVKRNIFNQADNTWTLYSTNQGKMSTMGLELSIKSIPVENLNLEVSGSYQKSENNESGISDIDLCYAPKFLGYVKAAYKIHKNSTIAISARYIDEMETVWNNSPIDPDNGNLNPIGRIGKKIEGYFVVDLNLRTVKLFSTGLFLSLNVSNLFDQEIRYPATWSNDWADEGTLGPGRMLLFTAGYEL